jgi:cytochrome c biogenesis protein
MTFHPRFRVRTGSQALRAGRRAAVVDAVRHLAADVICIASVIGTVLKQHEPAVNYVNQFGPFWAELFWRSSSTRCTAPGGSC